MHRFSGKWGGILMLHDRATSLQYMYIMENVWISELHLLFSGLPLALSCCIACYAMQPVTIICHAASMAHLDGLSTMRPLVMSGLPYRALVTHMPTCDGVHAQRSSSWHVQASSAAVRLRGSQWSRFPAPSAASL